MHTAESATPEIPKIGDRIEPPRFGFVAIAAAFENMEAARQNGYTETTGDYMIETFRIYGKPIEFHKSYGTTRMEFALVKLEKNG